MKLLTNFKIDFVAEFMFLQQDLFASIKIGFFFFGSSVLVPRTTNLKSFMEWHVSSVDNKAYIEV